jgi:virginiamycin B lyase
VSRALAAIALSWLAAATPAAAQAPIQTFPLGKLGAQAIAPGDGALTKDLAAGPDGKVWFIGRAAGRAVIGKIDVGGHVTRYTRIDQFSDIAAGHSITAGPDGNVWYTLGTRQPRDPGGVARITPSGAVTEFPLPVVGDEEPGRIDVVAAGPDGRLWVAGTPGVGTVSATGVYSFFPELPTCGSLTDMAPGPDGNMWYVNYDCGDLGFITPAGDVQTVASAPRLSNPIHLIAGRDKAMWFTQRNGTIRRQAIGGKLAIFRVPSPSETWGIVPGPVHDDHVYFTDATGAVGRIDARGRTDRYKHGLHQFSSPRTIVPGADGRLWFGEPETVPPAIGRITPVMCRVPDLRHKTIRQARRALRLSHCRLGKVTGNGDRVRSQKPKPGSVLREGTRVAVKLG